MEIDIICPVYNAAAGLLAAAADSAFDACTRAGLHARLVLVDDASTAPDTLAVLQRMQKQGALVLHTGTNVGPASARNVGLAAAGGQWVGFLDADDLWPPDRFARALRLMRLPEVNWIGGRHRLLGGAGEAPSLADALGIPAEGVAKGPALTRCLIANFWMHLGATTVRRDLLTRIGGFGPGLYYYEDFLLLTRLSLLSPLHLIDADTYVWRREGGGLTASPRRLSRDTLHMHEQAAKVASLTPFRRELRWARYSALKGLAVNNMLAGRRAAALRLALEAWAMDPREIGDFAAFAALCARAPQEARAAARRYTQAEIFVPEAP